MKKRISHRSIAIALVLCGGCLEPPDEDGVPLETFFGDPDVVPEDVLHVQDDPAFSDNVAQFATSVAYLRGFADGQSLWYWNVDGPNATFIAPLYQIIGADNQQIGRTIIDVIPGDTGYTPWWRVVEVHVTDKYTDQRIWSRDAIDAGIRAGILQAPLPTTTVVNCPVIVREATIPVSGDEADNVSSKWVWYRNERVNWVVFTDSIRVDVEEREMPRAPVYILQRITESAPLYEFLTGVDITGDNKLNDSNNIFAAGLDQPRYTPLWYVALVRTRADYVSIDTSTATRTVGLSSEADFFDADTKAVLSDMVVAPVLEFESMLVNCPIQRTAGAL